MVDVGPAPRDAAVMQENDGGGAALGEALRHKLFAFAAALPDALVRGLFAECEEEPADSRMAIQGALLAVLAASFAFADGACASCPVLSRHRRVRRPVGRKG